ncbi:hypothetical protein GCM10022222_34380 [Amycolatopsis ultiminotia]|uniref:GPP34 family phosphoprotein n=2 Tax=Amycolatopsis ultiminotia TaxID=543629 RepID=A0ABP6WA25_9PSEU
MDLQLPLYAKTLLLAYDTEQRKLIRKPHLSIAVRAAILAELVETGHLTDTPTGPTVTHGSRPPDAFLAGILDDLTGSPQRSWRACVRRHRSAALKWARDDLFARGILDHHGSAATAVHEAAIRHLHGHLATVLRASPQQRVDREDSALLGLAGAARLLHRHVSLRETRLHRERIRALTDHGGTVVVEARKAIRRRRAAMVSSAIAGSHGG